VHDICLNVVCQILRDQRKSGEKCTISMSVYSEICPISRKSHRESWSNLRIFLGSDP